MRALRSTPLPSSPARPTTAGAQAKSQYASAPALVAALADALDSLKAEDLVLIPLEGKASFADWMLIATGTSSRHLASLADQAAETLAAHNISLLGREGDGSADWVCVDAGDIVIHLFLPHTRSAYNLEKLWSFPA